MVEQELTARLQLQGALLKDPVHLGLPLAREFGLSDPRKCYVRRIRLIVTDVCARRGLVWAGVRYHEVRSVQFEKLQFRYLSGLVPGGHEGENEGWGQGVPLHAPCPFAVFPAGPVADEFI